ncbi:MULTISPECIES: arginase family protein [Actinoalloteichus]|uniref:Arginase family n=1 Tax=Actinoalloteichus fjordicus TaxID=1612552 RepID=A0AAC9LD73_9PSEU|nr:MULTISPECIES: arginase family protein [Actinoalloteichus]APU15462.1 Arginase family [Actinoalloteichus fjordicus]APU21530.1 Arginase family [Actinoalloteichus sp. GBA129-24]
MNPIVVLDAPSNLGLRMPAPGVLPGCYKLAGVLRDHGLLGRIGAGDAGYVVPPRYDVSDWSPGDGLFNGAAIAEYTARLAERIARQLDRGEFPFVLGGDCSILLAPMLALRRRGRYGLAYFDGSADFLRLAQAGRSGAAAGETLALATGRGRADVTDIDGLGPYVRDGDVVVLGNRDDDEDVPNLAEAGIACWTAPQIQAAGPAAVAARTLERFDGLDGFWVHLDVDVLDIEVLPAVDAPDPGGLQYGELLDLLRPMLADERCVGLHVTIYDPDLDQDGRYGAELTDAIVMAFADRPV